jgi:ribose 1,5-bisphosphokinase
MVTGRLIAVVGPSGAGKDTVMAGLVAARPDLHLVRRATTRDPALGGEPSVMVSETLFKVLQKQGHFVLSWQAHGLFYGIPAQVAAVLAAGQDALVNLSRGVLADAKAQFPTLVVLHLTARPETRAARLASRGRESVADIAQRLQRADLPLANGLDVRRVDNDGPLAATVAAALNALYPADPAIR